MLFVFLGVHITVVLVVLLYYVPIAVQSREGFVEVAKCLGLIAAVPYVPALLIVAHEIDQFYRRRRK